MLLGKYTLCTESNKTRRPNALCAKMENSEKNRIKIDAALNCYSTITENWGTAHKIDDWIKYIYYKPLKILQTFRGTRCTTNYWCKGHSLKYMQPKTLWYTYTLSSNMVQILNVLFGQNLWTTIHLQN